MPYKPPEPVAWYTAVRTLKAYFHGSRVEPVEDVATLFRALYVVPFCAQYRTYFSPPDTLQPYLKPPTGFSKDSAELREVLKVLRHRVGGAVLGDYIGYLSPAERYGTALDVESVAQTHPGLHFWLDGVRYRAESALGGCVVSYTPSATPVVEEYANIMFRLPYLIGFLSEYKAKTVLHKERKR